MQILQIKTCTGGPYCTKTREGNVIISASPRTSLTQDALSLTIFSIQLYSSLSLLPTDPAPFTIPGSGDLSKSQPEVSFSEYPLPDGSWEWVSSAWMIDMRDDGEVSYDGFEYNWLFRRRKWHPECKFGGFVRRRRFIRLMVRRAKALQPHLGTSASLAVSSTRSMMTAGFNAARALSLARDVWNGDDHDWARCRELMCYLARDGKRLEIWDMWLGVASERLSETHGEKSQPGETQTSESDVIQFPTSLEEEIRSKRLLPQWIASVVREHVWNVVFFILT